MKIIKTSDAYLSKSQWRKVFLATSIMTLVLYAVAMAFSLCGSEYFILKYQNPQMDSIEKWFRDRDILAILSLAFLTIESTVILTFAIGRLAKWWHILLLYGVNIGLSFAIRNSFQMAFTLSQIALCAIFVAIEKRKSCLKSYARLAIAFAVSFSLQVMIYVIKAGYFSASNHILTLSAHFIYSIESDIALSVILFTISLYINREKGDRQWETVHTHGGFSQTSRKHSPKSNSWKNLTKAQRNKVARFYVKLYSIQIGGFLLLMVLPFLLGKLFEFLTMYTAFAITRYFLGFKYSLHYKKETICITVGAAVFGILSLAVPFFYVTVIMAVLLGAALAILLHLSYKYKGFYMFNKVAKPDKFAELYVLMDGDLTPHHVEIICRHRGLSEEETAIIGDFAEGSKKSYIARKYSYSEKSIERKINEAIDKLADI